ncbi:MAG: hypothetical protein EP311_06645 [Cytophagales bacterium]|uniref:Lipocalin-like domain-containing protein n=1 Tax=Algoriphagus taiwanensis TaxID=1445656 RepID=A0ABQ6Q5V7_9BACT|nr:MAG: hypothetical protein EP311_06645 [Cytophagales bacterium]GMQ35554.1 hypothetical protein Ataiwa_38270 [Algoriphagus taiwanensis]
MKVNLSYLFLAALLILALPSCGGDDPTPEPPKSAEELATEALTGSGTQSWVVSGGGSVTRDNRDVTDIYSGFELILNAGSSKTYTSRNSNELFDQSGNWAFAGTNFDKFTLTGSKPAAGREISFTQENNTLRLQLTIPAPGARINGTFAIAGNYTFTLLKK